MTDSRWTYNIYGLTLRVNRPLLDLPTRPDSEAPDIVLDCTVVTRTEGRPEASQRLYSSPGLSPNGQPYLQVWRHDSADDDHLYVEYTDGSGSAVFIANREGSVVRIAWTQT
ncbi:MAG: hypothetical protein HKN91_11250, partial [Acidimicrobiia bacterium]|nr:hypothetical protein [Acidimicrobiia bacterium]